MWQGPERLRDLPKVIIVVMLEPGPGAGISLPGQGPFQRLRSGEGHLPNSSKRDSTKLGPEWRSAVFTYR